MSSTEPATEDRIVKVLDELGVHKAHVVACLSSDWGGLVNRFPDQLCSLTVVSPHLNQGIPKSAETSSIPSLIIAGDQGAPAERALLLSQRLANSRLHALPDYESPIWADTVADRPSEVETVLRSFWAEVDCDISDVTLRTSEDVQQIAGIHYRTQGSGPPIVFLPLSLSASQWKLLIERINKDFCSIVLGGPYLGAISLLEDRARSGYGQLLAEIMEQVQIRKGERILEVGCGSGALVRYLAQMNDQQNPIVGSDLSPYLLEEARLIAKTEGHDHNISFEQADAENLPYADQTFDVSISCTVMEEGNADRMINELIRVTRPGGRIVAIVRAMDVDWWVNIPLSPDRQREINSLGAKVGAGVGPGGCADASLYRRIATAGSRPNVIGPRFAFYRGGERMVDVLERLRAVLSEDVRPDFQKAIDDAEAAGTICVGEPFHCAVMRK